VTLSHLLPPVPLRLPPISLLQGVRTALPQQTSRRPVPVVRSAGLADWMVRQVGTSAQVVLDAAGSEDSAAAGATAAGLQRVNLDRVGLAAAPGAAARRTQMRLEEGGSPDPMVKAELGYGARLLEVGSPVAASLATAGMRKWGSEAARAPAANSGDAGLEEAGSAAAAAAAASRKSAGLDGAGSAADTGPAANRGDAGHYGAGVAADTVPAANRGNAGIDEAGSAAAVAAAASRQSTGLGGAGLAAGTVPAACPGDPGLDGMGWAAASAAATTRGDAGLDDAGSAVATAVDRGKEGVQLEVVAPRPQLLVVEPLKWAECAPPTDTGRMARTGDNRHRRPACVGTHNRTAADRAGAPILRSDAALEEVCCRNGRSSQSLTPRGQRAKDGRLCTERPPKR